MAILAKLERGDLDGFEAAWKTWIIPCHEKWFVEVFGHENGRRLAAAYQKEIDDSRGRPGDPGRLLKRAQAGISVYRITDPEDPRATGGQKDVLRAMVNPIPLYSIRMDGLHLWSFVYVDGQFRAAGKMYRHLAVKQPSAEEPKP